MRWLRALLGVGLVLALLVCGAGYALFQLQSERNSAFLREHFTSLVTQALGTGHELKLGEARLEFAGFMPRFVLGDISIRNAATGGEAQLAQTSFSISPMSLARFSPEARVVRFSGLKLVLPEAESGATTLRVNEVLGLLRGTLAAIHIAISGQDPSFAALRSVEGENISIYRRGEGGQPQLLREGLALHMAHSEAGVFTAQVERPGGQKLVMKARSETGAAGPRIVLETGDVPAGTLFDLVGSEVAGIDPGLALTFRLTSSVDERGQLAQSVIRIGARGGRIELPDPDMIPFELQEAVAELVVKPGESEVAISQLLVRFNETHIEASGTLTPIAGLGRGLAVKLKATKAVLDRLSTKEEIVELDFAEGEGELSQDLSSFRLDRLDIAEDEGRARLTGRFSTLNGGLIETQFEGSGFGARKALRIWPVWVSPEVRAWLIGHLRGGRIAKLSLYTKLEGEVLRNAFAKKPVPDDALLLNFRLEQAELAPLDDAPPMTKADGYGVVSGRKANFVIERGQVALPNGKTFAIGASKIGIADTSRKPAHLEMSIPAIGKLDALLAFLATPSLRSITGLPPNFSVAEGNFDGVALLQVPIGTNAQAKDTKVELKGDLKGVVVENVVRGEKLESSALSMVSRAGTLSVKGDARFFGVPGQVDVRVDPKGALAQVKMTLDEAALARKGIDLRPSISGPLGITASLPLGRADAPVDFDVDLARATIAAPVPGIAKSAGQAGRAKFSLKSDDAGHHIEALETDFGNLSLRGKVEIGKDGAFLKADLSQFKLSGGDNTRLSAEKAGRGYKLLIRGNSFDLRPFLRGVQSGKIESGGTPVDFDLDLATTVLVGFGGELMSGAELKLVRKAGQVHELNLKGQFSGAPTRITSQVQGKNTALKITSEDAGSLARFLDLYSRAHGGLLSADVMLMPNNVQQGSLQMRDFFLRGEAGLRSVSPNAKDGQAVIRGTDDVPFRRLKAQFHRRPGRMEIAEAVMWGPQVGGTMEGVLDYAADRVSIQGTFVPAYALNNLFAKVPILGPILGGGQYEGLFAVPFIITGRVSAPDLRVNPVSAIAPGFLRKFFEIRRESQ